MRRATDDAIEALIRIKDQPPNLRNLDNTQSIWMLRGLQQIEAKMYEQPYGPFRAAELMPIESNIALGAMSWGYRRITRRGKSKWITTRSMDLEPVQANSKLELFPMRKHGLFADWTIDDVWAGTLSGEPLPAELSIAARRGIDQFNNSVFISGDTEVGLTGFINDPVIDQGNATNGSWATATGDDIIQDISDAFLDVWDQSEETFMPDSIALPRAQWARIKTTARTSGTDTTILQYVLDNVEGLKNITPLKECKNGGLGGAIDRLVVYKKDPEVLVAKAATLFMVMPICDGPLAMSYEQASISKIGGMVWKAPIAAVYRDGI